MKTCKVCGQELPISCFSKHSAGRLRTTCKPCRAEAAKGWYKDSDKTEMLRKAKEYKEHRRVTHRAHYLMTAAKQRSKKKKLDYDLDQFQSELQAIMDAGVCQITGIPFNLTAKQAWNSPSLDRIVPSKGYIRSNVRIVLFSLNIMMHDWGLDTVEQVMSALNKRKK